jgi:hypothetical protein
MMHETKNIYTAYVKHKIEPEEAFRGNYPEWPLIDKIGDMWITRILFGLAYTAFYVAYATNPFLYLLLPIQWFIGPVQGAIVNWCGHKYINTATPTSIIKINLKIRFHLIFSCWVNCSRTITIKALTARTLGRAGLNSTLRSL